MSLAALAQRRHADLHDLQAEEQVAAELARLHGLFQRLVGGRHHADIDLDRRAAADALERMPFQHAQAAWPAC